MDDLITERNFESQAIGQASKVIDVLGLFVLYVIHGCLYNQVLADVQLTGAGIICLYCNRCNDAKYCAAWTKGLPLLTGHILYIRSANRVACLT